MQTLKKKLTPGKNLSMKNLPGSFSPNAVKSILPRGKNVLAILQLPTPRK